MIKKYLSVILILCFVLMSLNTYAVTSKSIDKTKIVNINKADVKELTTLPGIGEKTAQRIINFRKSNGKFKKKSDVLKVKGIGEKKFKKIEKLITI